MTQDRKSLAAWMQPAGLWLKLMCHCEERRDEAIQ